MNTLPPEGSLFRAASERPAAPSIFDATAPVAPGKGEDFRDHMRGPAQAEHSETASSAADARPADEAPPAAPSQESQGESQHGATASDEPPTAPPAEPVGVAPPAAAEETAEETAPAAEVVAQEKPTAEAETEVTAETEEQPEVELEETAEPLVAAVVVEEEAVEETPEAESEAETSVAETESKEETHAEPVAKTKAAKSTNAKSPAAEAAGESEPAPDAPTVPEEATTSKPAETAPVKLGETTESETIVEAETEAADEPAPTTAAKKQSTKPAAAKTADEPALAATESETREPAEDEGIPVTNSKQRKAKRGTSRTGEGVKAKNNIESASAKLNSPLAPSPTESAQIDPAAPLAVAEVDAAVLETTLPETATSTGSEADTKAATAKVEANATQAAAEAHPRNVLGPRRSAAAPGELRLNAAERGQFVQRVTRAIETAQERGGPIRIRLSPPELGSVRVELTVEQGVLNARLEAETPYARNLLMENLAALKERLADQQIRVEQFDVELSQQQTGGQTFGHETGDRQPHEGGTTASRAPSVSGGESETNNETPAPGLSADGRRLNVVV